MQRNENESFSDYKARRNIANLALKDINKDVKAGGSGASSRAKQRQARSETGHAFSTGIKGVASSNFTPYGAGLAASRATRMATTERLEAHKAHLAHMEHRRLARLAEQHGM
jgi:alanine dehydrogenase